MKSLRMKLQKRNVIKFLEGVTVPEVRRLTDTACIYIYVIKNTPVYVGKASSCLTRNSQHMNNILDYLELAHKIIFDDGRTIFSNLDLSNRNNILNHDACIVQLSLLMKDSINLRVIYQPINDDEAIKDYEGYYINTYDTNKACNRARVKTMLGPLLSNPIDINHVGLKYEYKSVMVKQI